MQPSELRPHPLADLFPLIEGQEFDDLVQDIAEWGVREPITVTPDGFILDGRNRYRATQRLGWDCPSMVTDLPAQAWAAFVISLNIRRRHLTETQRATVAAELENLGHGERADRRDANLHLSTLPLEEKPAAVPPVTRREAAEMLNVSPRLVAAAASVRDHAVPEIKDRVKSGGVSVSAAAEIAKQPEPAQREIAKLEDKALKAKVSELREAKKRHDDKIATLPTKAEAIEISKRDKVMVRANDGEMHLYVPPEQTKQYDVWLEMKPVVMALAEPKHSAEIFAASTDDFWRPKFGAHLDAAIAYLTEVKAELERINGTQTQAA